jgi:hypothetical protein
MKKIIGVCFVLLLAAGWVLVPAQGSDQAHWPQWRGPSFDGMARGDAPTAWGDTSNVKWKADIPGRGFSTPVIWGDKIFLTTAIPTGKPAAAPAPAPAPSPGATATSSPGERRGRAESGPQVEHKFDVLCLDRKTGKLLWQRTAKVAVPHEGYHRAYGSFASNSPVTDGKYLYVSFGSRGVYCYDLAGKLLWEKDLGVQMKMRNAFGEGTAPLLVGDRLILVFDQEAGSFVADEPGRSQLVEHAAGCRSWRTQTSDRRGYEKSSRLRSGGWQGAMGSCRLRRQCDSCSCPSERGGVCDERLSRSAPDGDQVGKSR